MQREQKQGLAVKRSRPGMGLGLFTSESIGTGEFIVAYKGKVISTDYADTLKTKYLFQIDDNYTIDGSGRDNLARYMNHFCEPNVEADISAGEIQFFALRDIAAGEELGYDYGQEYVDEFIRPNGCKCPSCGR